MSLSRHLDSSGVAHANADSKTHARHVRQRSQQRALAWIPEEVSEDHPAAEFKLQAGGLGLANGAYFTGAGESETPVSGSEFESHCSAVNWDRRWNVSTMKRGNKVAKVRRKRTTPACEEFVINFSPSQMRFINGELARWEQAQIPPEKRKEMLLALVDEIRRDVVAEFKRVTGRDVVASYVHFDSAKVHFGIVHSRVNEKNELVGSKRLGTVGPWSVGQNRISKLGLVDPGDGRLRENLERFHARFGADRQPLDVALHDLLDEKFSAMVSAMGEDAEARFGEAVEYYKTWKQKARRESVFRSPSSQAVAWRALRLVSPLLPPQVRTALVIARTAVQAFQIVSTAIDAVSAPTAPAPTKDRQPELTKTK